jgi:hypothetical protein
MIRFPASFELVGRRFDLDDTIIFVDFFISGGVFSFPVLHGIRKALHVMDPLIDRRKKTQNKEENTPPHHHYEKFPHFSFHIILSVADVGEIGACFIFEPWGAYLVQTLDDLV